MNNEIIDELIEALQRFDSLDTVISEIREFNVEDDGDMIEDLTEFLNGEADYCNEYN